MKLKKENLLLYAVTDSILLKEREIGEAVEDAILGGAGMIQLRSKNASYDELLRDALRLREVTLKYGIPLIINDNIQVCIKSGADGVHIGQKDMPAAEARRLLGADKIIGVSARTCEQAVEAEKSGADYLGTGAAFVTGTKTDAAAIDHSMYREISKAVSIPVVAIGGINAENIERLKGSGAAGVAVVSGIFAYRDIKAAAARLKYLSEKYLG